MSIIADNITFCYRCGCFEKRSYMMAVYNKEAGEVFCSLCRRCAKDFKGKRYGTIPWGIE